MEGGYNQCPKQTKTNSALTIHLRNNKANAGAAVRDANVNAPKDVVEHHGKQPLDPSLPKSCVLREQDLYMPIANVIRIMRRILPNHAKISDDAKETVQECVSEFISFITGEANQRCRDEERKTITSEDIVWAMKQLDFNDYIEPITAFLIRYRESQNGRSLVRKEPNSMPHGGGGDGGEVVDYEPLPMVDGSGPLEMGGAGPPGSFGPAGYNLGTQQVFFDPSMMNPYNFRYNNSDSTGGSSSPPGYLPGFNPYAHYK